MRTTISIDDNLLRSAKLTARERESSLGNLLEDALRRELARIRAEREHPPQVKPLPVFNGGTGAYPGVDLNSNRALAEFLDPPEKYRQDIRK
ncbi:MAG: antitoxin [Candidatus Dormibacteraceae bacterium]